MEYSFLECRVPSIGWEGELYSFFQDVLSSGSSDFFHPHPFTFEEAKNICQYDGLDIYYIVVNSQKVVAYGMLRGWDEGYTVPSLGIVVHSRYRGIGIGKGFMHFLHMASRARGATKIRLKVYPSNLEALSLYTSLGYKFELREAEQLVGVLKLS